MVWARSSIRWTLGWRWIALLACWVSAVSTQLPAFAQSSAPAPAKPCVIALERQEDGLWLSAQLQFELSASIVDALHRGIAVFFVARAQVRRHRWYWSDPIVADATRYYRLVYQPLTNRWRVHLGFGDIDDSALGSSISQTYATLADALAVIRAIPRWKIAEGGALDDSARHDVEFHFELDTTQLPRPLQIGTLGASDWDISLHAAQSLAP